MFNICKLGGLPQANSVCPRKHFLLGQTNIELNNRTTSRKRKVRDSALGCSYGAQKVLGMRRLVMVRFVWAPIEGYSYTDPSLANIGTL